MFNRIACDVTTTRKTVFDLFLSAKPKTKRTHKTRKPGFTRRPPAVTRKVKIGNCDSDDNIRVQDDQTLTGKIVVTKCGCERRFRNNATRRAEVSKTVADRLRVYFQKLYNTTINYPVVVKMLTGNHSHTVFGYTVKVPSSDQTKVKNALKQACKDDKVSGCVTNLDVELMHLSVNI